MIILHQLLLRLATNSCVILTHTSFLSNRAHIILDALLLLHILLFYYTDEAPGKQKRQRTTTTATQREKPPTDQRGNVVVFNYSSSISGSVPSSYTTDRNNMIRRYNTCPSCVYKTNNLIQVLTFKCTH